MLAPTVPVKQYKSIAAYYDAEYADTPMLQRDVPFLLSQMPRRGVNVLEIAVGTARAAVPLALAGHRVTGIDYDPAMIKIAQARRAAAGLDDKRLRLIEADALHLDRARLTPGTFDWAIILFNSLLVFTTLPQQDTLLSGIARLLKPRGRLWIDVFNPDHAMLAPDEATGLEPMTFYVPHLARTVFRTTDLRRDHTSTQTQILTFHYRWFDDHGREKHSKVTFPLTHIFPREMQLLLERNGFHIEQQWGDHDGSPLVPTSDRIIVQARRMT